MAYISFQPKDFFRARNYTGTGSELTVANVEFQPDFTWIKNRASGNHYLYDAARGATISVYSNDSSGNLTVAESLKSWNANGFVLGTNGDQNTSANTYSHWNWKAATSSGITTNGSTTITPSYYRFDATRGTAILVYTGNGTAGAKLAHGLGVAPEFIMYKKTSGSENWGVYHHNVGTSPTDSAGYKLSLNGTDARNDDNAFMDDTAPDATNITLGSSSWVNGNLATYVAYCFVGKKGFSKFHSFTGNGDADGPFVYTGFRPAFVFQKVATQSTGWFATDITNQGFNEKNYPTGINYGNAETTTNHLNFFSNGFKYMSTNGSYNYDGQNTIYMAWAENPIVSSNDTPGLAR